MSTARRKAGVCRVNEREGKHSLQDVLETMGE